VGDVDSLHVEIDNLNDPLVGFCFIRSIDVLGTFADPNILLWRTRGVGLVLGGDVLPLVEFQHLCFFDL
jgi:hypothetical protein